MSSLPLVTLGAVTERPEAQDFLWWNLLRQDYYPLEVIVVDASKPRATTLYTGRGHRGRIGLPPVASSIIYASSVLPCGELRNIVLDHAAGQYVVWFDDDDWYHPHRVRWLVDAVSASGEPWAGWDRGWFLFLDGMTCENISVRGAPSVINGAAIYRTEAAQAVRYDAKPKGSDRRWIRHLSARFGTVGTILGDDRPHSLWTRHKKNTSPSRQRLKKLPLKSWASRVEPEIWGDSTPRLEALGVALRT